jgi:hypothetical protein
VKIGAMIDSRWQSVGVIATFVGHDVVPSLGQTIRGNEAVVKHR